MCNQSLNKTFKHVSLNLNSPQTRHQFPYDLVISCFIAIVSIVSKSIQNSSLKVWLKTTQFMLGSSRVSLFRYYITNQPQALRTAAINMFSSQKSNNIFHYSVIYTSIKMTNAKKDKSVNYVINDVQVKPVLLNNLDKV